MCTRGIAERAMQEVQLTGLKKSVEAKKSSATLKSIHVTHIFFTFEEKFGIPLGALYF